MTARLTPCSRREFIRKLRMRGYDGPYPGGKHEFMAAQGKPPIRVPNPHSGQDISVDLLSRILREAGIERDAWART
jgi:predicted RNA binding protein YcfA (HicA-like mRNA interferase family)